MKVFLSWSGLRSRAVAEALNDWLRRVIQAVKPFYSPEIEKGAKWSSEIDNALEGTRFGIICLTPDNLNSVWIHYEAGALSKTKDALVWTFLHGLTPGDVPPPLGKFQHTVADKDDVLRLLKSINKRLEEIGIEPLQDRLLEENFELFWPRFKKSLKEAENLSGTPVPGKAKHEAEMPRDERAILDEILELVRSQERRLAGFEERIHNTPSQVARRHLSKIVYYSEIRVPITSKESDAEAIATKLNEAFRILTIGSTVSIEAKPSGPVVRVLFAQPMRRGLIQEIIDSVSKMAGYNIASYEAIHAD